MFCFLAERRDTLRSPICRPLRVIASNCSYSRLHSPKRLSRLLGCFDEPHGVLIPPLNTKKQNTQKGVLFFGGEKGIRTPERVLAVTRFPIVRLRPAQPSLRISYSLLQATKALYFIFKEKSSIILKNFNFCFK